MVAVLLLLVVLLNKQKWWWLPLSFLSLVKLVGLRNLAYSSRDVQLQLLKQAGSIALQ